MPKRPDHPGAKQVCDANPGYADLGPDSTVCKFFAKTVGQEGYSPCTAWFIDDNLMVTAGHCMVDTPNQYFLDPEDPGMNRSGF